MFSYRVGENTTRDWRRRVTPRCGQASARCRDTPPPRTGIRIGAPCGADRKCTRPFGATTPAAPPQHPPPAATPCPRRLRRTQRAAARLWLVLGRRLRMGEGRASGVPWGEGLGKGDLGRLEGSVEIPERQPLAPRPAPLALQKLISNVRGRGTHLCCTHAASEATCDVVGSGWHGPPHGRTWSVRCLFAGNGPVRPASPAERGPRVGPHTAGARHGQPVQRPLSRAPAQKCLLEFLSVYYRTLSASYAWDPTLCDVRRIGKVGAGFSVGQIAERIAPLGAGEVSR